MANHGDNVRDRGVRGWVALAIVPLGILWAYAGSIFIPRFVSDLGNHLHSSRLMLLVEQSCPPWILHMLVLGILIAPYLAVAIYVLVLVLHQLNGRRGRMHRSADSAPAE